MKISLILCYEGILENNFQRFYVFFIPFGGTLFFFSRQLCTILLTSSKNIVLLIFM